MKLIRIISLVVVLAALGAGAALIRPQFNRYSYLLGLVQPCRQPIRYAVGQIDDRFRISPEELTAIAKQAETIWESSVDHNLFEYDPQSALTVNLWYDERQALTKQSSNIATNIEASKQSYDSLKQKYDSLVASYNKRLKEYNETVDYWNSRGGAPPAQYNELQKEARDLNALADQINGLANQLNTLAQQLNLKVDQFNTVAGKFNEVLGIKPEAGKYSPLEGSITVYQFADSNDLMLTLAHEFGHTLSLNHIDTKDAIMNPQRTDNTHLTDADISALRQVCAYQST